MATYEEHRQQHVDGVFTLRSDRLETDQFSDLQIDFLQRLVNTISVGYARWRELLRLERDRTVQRMRAEVQAMQQGDDIIDLMGLLWEELHRVGLDFHYVSITVGDEGDDDVHLYMVWHRKFRDTVAAPYTLLRADITPTADVYYKRIPRRIWNEYHTEFTGVRQFTNEEVPAYVERTIRMWRAGEAGDGRPATPVHAWVLMAAHLPQGRIVLAQFQEAPESPAASSPPKTWKSSKPLPRPWAWALPASSTSSGWSATIGTWRSSSPWTGCEPKWPPCARAATSPKWRCSWASS